MLRTRPETRFQAEVLTCGGPMEFQTAEGAGMAAGRGWVDGRVCANRLRAAAASRWTGSSAEVRRLQRIRVRADGDNESGSTTAPGRRSGACVRLPTEFTASTVRFPHVGRLRGKGNGVQATPGGCAYYSELGGEEGA